MHVRAAFLQKQYLIRFDLRKHKAKTSKNNYANSSLKYTKSLIYKLSDKPDSSFLGMVFIILDLIQMTSESIVGPYSCVQR